MVWLWMIVWWLAIASSLLSGLGLSFFGEVGMTGGAAVLIGPSWHVELFTFSAISLQTMGTIVDVSFLATHAAAYGLLALIVHRIGQGSIPR